MKKLLTYTLSLLAAISCLQEERSPEEILVPSLAQVECSDASLVLTSKVPKGSEKLVDECGFYYGKEKSMANAAKLPASIEVNNFTAELPSREYGSTYYICSFVTNGHGSEIRSEVSSYSLKDIDKYIQFEPIELISYNKAEATAEVTFDVEIWSGVKVSEIGVCFGVTTSPATEGRHVNGVMSEEGTVSVSLEKFATDKEYYLRAYVRDGDYTAYGEVTPLTIKLLPPTLSSVIVSSVKAASATFSSAVTSDGGDKVVEVGFYYSTDEAVNPETSFKVNQPYSSDSFSLEATNLKANTKYYVKSFAINSIGASYSEVVSFTTSAAAPSVTTLGATEVTESGALLSGNVTSDNGAEITERGFVWDAGSVAPTISSNKIKVDGTLGEYTATLTDVDPNQKYSFRAYAINAEGTSYGEVMTFTTTAGLPSLSATGVSEITTTSAKFTSTVVSNGGETVTEVGFYYSTAESVDPSSAQKVSMAYVEDRFSLTAEGLKVGTTYYVMAYARNSAGEAYNTIATFKTGTTAPTVATIGSGDITSSSAVLSGEIIADNGEPVTDAGFMWMIGEGTPYSNQLSAGTISGTYSASLTSLLPNQIYSYRAYATNARGTSYGGVLTFRTLVALPDVAFVGSDNITSSSASLSANITSQGGETVTEVGFLYGITTPLDPSTALKVCGDYSQDTFTYDIEDLARATVYYVQPFATNSAGTAYGDIAQFATLPELPVVSTSEVVNVTESSAVAGGAIVDDGGGEILAKGVVWSRKENPTVDLSTKTNDGAGLSSFTSSVTGLFSGTTYYLRAYATNAVGTSYGEQKEFVTYGDHIEYFDAANCFIVSEAGTYMFDAVKGNSSESVGDVASVEVLWESFGTETVPQVGDLIKAVNYEIGTITFTTSDIFNEGNAVIAAKDASGEILWSWHIWLTDLPEEQVYYNNAGTMMDRNLGAILTTPGDVGALGLLYQWGRKDPFLGSASNYSNILASSTITWPSQVISSPEEGTIEYTISHPTTFIIADPMNFDWYYTRSTNTDDTRWMSDKTIYDPCPLGWRVPDGGENGVWSTAKGSFADYSSYDNTNKGMNFSGYFGNDATIWYPASGYLYYLEGYLDEVRYYGRYWSCSSSPNDSHCACYLNFDYEGNVNPVNDGLRAYGYPVRCFKEGTGGGPQHDNDFSISVARSLSDAGTANSYIVSSAGTYSIPAVKGNSSEPVGAVAYVEVLWETFGTDERITKGDLVAGAKYENGHIYFKTGRSYREGNAVIAAKAANGTILWSWHIWFTDQPQEQVYYDTAGTMMDRNLGAISATPGDVGALGLFYQWGRKDPFIGSSSISNSVVAKSTRTGLFVVSSNSANGTIAYATEHPTTFITYNNYNRDWYYTGSSSTDDTRWQSEKTIYDPCPAGWRVPEGGEEVDDGVWSIAKGSSSKYSRSYDGTSKGMNFSGDFGNDAIIWYSASGYLDRFNGEIDCVGISGFYWSCSSLPNDSDSAYSLSFDDYDYVYPVNYSPRAYGGSVRCFKEGTEGGPQYDNDFLISGARSLSDAGTANSYIVSNSGTYSIPAVKGNSSESVGSVASAEVLWETFGTDERVFKGSLVSGAKYENGQIYFKTADFYREGNVVIAAKDASGTILWSWHIWLTDQPQEQVYYNNAGTMMDRNLGATSAIPGDVGALGLLYQWGRKDPFLGSSSISSNTMAKSSITWPSAVLSNSTSGTIEYVIEHPTTIITCNDDNNNWDWHYTSFELEENIRWQSDKTIYDPCPVGWRVPDGGEDGVWKIVSFSYYSSYDDVNKGMNFSGNLGDDATIWYPASGHRSFRSGGLSYVGNTGYSWSCSSRPNNNSLAYHLYFGNDGYVSTLSDDYRANGKSVRCLKEQ